VPAAKRPGLRPMLLVQHAASSDRRSVIDLFGAYPCQVGMTPWQPIRRREISRSAYRPQTPAVRVRNIGDTVVAVAHTCPGHRRPERADVTVVRERRDETTQRLSR
jgi:hypothetical protein